jgi:hypothetical protein
MLPRDKLLHIALGVLAIACALGALFIHAWFGLGPCLAYTTTAVGVLYEVQQWYRKEGQPDPLDALATAAPGWLAWLVLEMMK